MREIEIKYRLGDPAALRSSLLSCGARQRGCVLEMNRILDFTDGRLRAEGTGLRLRSSTPLAQIDAVPLAANLSGAASAAASHILTYKGPMAERDGIRDRTEIETRIEDADQFLKLLKALGLVERLRFEKVRESWWIDGGEVVIDRLPSLGWFCEIEAADEASIRQIAQRIGLGEAAPEPRTYPAMVSAAGQAGPDGVVELRFG
ncbi:MAG: class IV adenylate cyclase [Phycisphaerae bacterium]|nr:class IV adenylate cyclase [Phycisphaerae bacterium]